MRSFTLGLLLCFSLVAGPALRSQDQALRAQALLEQGAKLMKEGQPDAAEPVLRQAITLDPENALPFFYLGTAQSGRKEFADAALSFRSALLLDDKKPALGRMNRREAQDSLGLSLAMLKDYSASQAVYRAAMAQDSAYPSFPYNLACVCALAGDRKASLEALSKAEDADARWPSGPLLPDPAADTDLKGLWGEPVFQAILLMNVGPQPTDGPASGLVREGARLLGTGDAEGAEAKERAATEAAPGNQQAWFFLAGALEQNGKTPASADAFGKSLALAKPPDIHLTKPMLRYAHLRIGERALAEGRNEEAAAAFRAASEEDPYRPQAFYGLARAEAGLGDKKAAGDALKKAFALRAEAIVLDLPLADPAKEPAFAKWSADQDWKDLLRGL